MRGDRDAIAALWRQHRRWVAAVLLAHKPRTVDLEDLLQDVAMTLVSKIHTLRDETHVRAWLRTVAINAARACARSGRAKPRLSIVDGSAEDGSERGIVLEDDLAVDESIAADEEQQRVMSQVRELPETYREPLLLRALHGMRSREIGEILGIPPATVDTRVARARRLLRRRLDGLESKPDGHHPDGAKTRSVT